MGGGGGEGGGGLAKKEGDVSFEGGGVDTPMHTMGYGNTVMLVTFS